VNIAASPLARTHSALASPSRVALIDRIRGSADPLDAHQLAEQCNLHVTTVRFHLDALINAGLITSRSAPSRGRGRPRLLYSPVMQSDGGAHDGYEDLTWLLLRALAGSAEAPGSGPAARAEAAGYEWAADNLATTETSAVPAERELENAAPKINAFFTELGFEPDMTAAPPNEDLEFTLHSCPFLNAAPPVVRVFIECHEAATALPAPRAKSVAAATATSDLCMSAPLDQPYSLTVMD